MREGKRPPPWIPFEEYLSTLTRLAESGLLRQSCARARAHSGEQESIIVHCRSSTILPALTLLWPASSPSLSGLIQKQRGTLTYHITTPLLSLLSLMAASLPTSPPKPGQGDLSAWIQSVKAAAGTAPAGESADALEDEIRKSRLDRQKRRSRLSGQGVRGIAESPILSPEPTGEQQDTAGECARTIASTFGAIFRSRGNELSGTKGRSAGRRVFCMPANVALAAARLRQKGPHDGRAECDIALPLHLQAHPPAREKTPCDDYLVSAAKRRLHLPARCSRQCRAHLSQPRVLGHVAEQPFSLAMAAKQVQQVAHARPLPSRGAGPGRVRYRSQTLWAAWLRAHGWANSRATEGAHPQKHRSSMIRTGARCQV